MKEPERARFPYMPFYVDDWLLSEAVDDFTLEQEGAYLRLLLRQWSSRAGVLPTNEQTLARWSRLGARWRKVGRPIIKRCFVQNGKGLVNLKCRKLWEQARAKSVQARAAAEARWND